MTAIRVIFDGKSFIPQQPVSLPEHAEAVVYMDEARSADQANQLNDAVRAYYQAAPDAADDAWGAAVLPESTKAWDEV